MSGRTAQTSRESLATSLDLEGAVEDLPWEVGLARDTMSPVETVTFTSQTEAVGVLTYFVRIVPAYDKPTDTLHGFRVERYHENQEDPTVVESHIGSRETALETAVEEMERLTY